LLRIDFSDATLSSSQVRSKRPIARSVGEKQLTEHLGGDTSLARRRAHQIAGVPAFAKQ
jgi:hypothetical protein